MAQDERKIRQKERLIFEKFVNGLMILLFKSKRTLTKTKPGR